MGKNNMNIQISSGQDYGEGPLPVQARKMRTKHLSPERFISALPLSA